MNIRNLLAAIGLIALGAAASNLVPRARAGTGTWQCYVQDRLPDWKAAEEWKGARAMTETLNVLAPDTASGTLQMIYLNTSAAGMPALLMCTKR
jgi:hypothetical protein